MPEEPKNETTAEVAKDLANKAVDAGEAVGTLVVAVPVEAARLALRLLREAADRIEHVLGSK